MKSFEFLLTNRSKAFDYLNHELITAKLNAYGFNLPALRLIHDYLSNRKQQIKIDDNYSIWSEISFGVPQRVNFRTSFMCDALISTNKLLNIKIGNCKTGNSECEKLSGTKLL